MKKVIIVGAGKAGYLHYLSYLKFLNKKDVYIVDIKSKSNYFKNEKIYNNIENCMKNNNILKDDVIIDLCTPKSEFLDLIEKCKKLKLKNILVEKPFTFQNIRLIEDMNIVMVENYLYSKPIEYVEKYINDKNLKLKLFYGNFSKNRMIDSFSGRNMTTSEIPNNLEIELPHLIYMSLYFLNKKELNNDIVCSKDMKVGNIQFKNHGYGLIISHYKNIEIVLESNLMSSITQKKIIMTFNNNITIEINFAIYSNKLELMKKANVSILSNAKMIKYITFDEDDNMFEFIKKSYNYFNDKADNPNYISILDFSALLNKYNNNLSSKKEFEYESKNK